MIALCGKGVGVTERNSIAAIKSARYPNHRSTSRAAVAAGRKRQILDHWRDSRAVTITAGFPAFPDPPAQLGDRAGPLADPCDHGPWRRRVEVFNRQIVRQSFSRRAFSERARSGSMRASQALKAMA